MFFFKNDAENEAGRLVLDLFLFCKIALYEIKASGLQGYILKTQTSHQTNLDECRQM